MTSFCSLAGEVHTHPLLPARCWSIWKISPPKSKAVPPPVFMPSVYSTFHNLFIRIIMTYSVIMQVQHEDLYRKLIGRRCRGALTSSFQTEIYKQQLLYVKWYISSRSSATHSLYDASTWTLNINCIRTFMCGYITCPLTHISLVAPPLSMSLATGQE